MMRALSVTETDLNRTPELPGFSVSRVPKMGDLPAWALPGLEARFKSQSLDCRPLPGADHRAADAFERVQMCRTPSRGDLRADVWPFERVQMARASALDVPIITGGIAMPPAK